MNTAEIKQAVKDRYGRFAESGGGTRSCCSCGAASSASGYAAGHGLYAHEQLATVPALALNLSRGCGNPTGFANLQRGEVVVDLGCGAGIDVILAAQNVGPEGEVVGVDFTAPMIERTKQTVAETGLTDTVELLVGDIARLELPDGFADVVISNCVINLSPDKDAVYREVFRILKPAGRVAISDIVMTEKTDAQVQKQFQSTWAGCLGGIIDEESYFQIVREAGFRQLDIVGRHILSPQGLEEMACCPGPDFGASPPKEDLALIQGKVVSIKFIAAKPRSS